MNERAALHAELIRLTSWRREFEAFDSDVDARVREIQAALSATTGERRAAA